MNSPATTARVCEACAEPVRPGAAVCFRCGASVIDPARTRSHRLWALAGFLVLLAGLFGMGVATSPAGAWVVMVAMVAGGLVLLCALYLKWRLEHYGH